KVLQALSDGHLKTSIAAARLGLSTRQTLRLLRRYQSEGASGLQNRRQGTPGHRQLPPGLESRIRGLIRDSYADFGPTLAAEKLRERHGIEISKACVSRIWSNACRCSRPMPSG
ncbi:helix-turn-helix domain-containing protein, partial [Ralstonia pseudosolanacearum]